MDLVQIRNWEKQFDFYSFVEDANKVYGINCMEITHIISPEMGLWKTRNSFDYILCSLYKTSLQHVVKLFSIVKNHFNHSLKFLTRFTK